ncbi:MAG: glycosyltransferase family 39 protein [Armatimonadota bacterium]|nr:glycosyltransferase family 39 protein [Armatimonadota bacterium]MDR7443547.1 glycosyltransferase family 39 protein [Armatimonadota bacterium]MDR7570957.1 glycosyltransferase family 39 protein [Armatimonadota bacterium]MDR7615045.1 glycosyltransferase family 39 protein [Armatimonadota bacterium]
MTGTRSLSFLGSRPGSLAVPAGVFLLAVLVRVLAVSLTVGWPAPASAEPSSDSRIHMTLVQNLLSGRGYALDGEPVASTPPLYVFFLAALYAVFGSPVWVRAAQVLLGAAGCVVLYTIGRRIFDPATALLSAGLLALHPATAYLAGLHLTENLFLPLLLLVLLQAQHLADRLSAGRAFGLGVLVGLGALVRAVFLGFLPFLLFWAWLRVRGRGAPRYRVFGLVMAGCALVLLPWTVRNAVVLRAFVPVQSNGAMVFWAGNNPHADGGLVWPTRRTWTGGRPPDDGHYGWRDLGVSEENARYLQEALRWIREHPGDYLRLLGRKLARLYGFSRATDDQGLEVPLGVAVFQGLLYVAAAAGWTLAWARRKSVALLGWLVVFTNLMALVFSGASRYALPMVPSLVLFAGFTLRNAWRWAEAE